MFAGISGTLSYFSHFLGFRGIGGLHLVPAAIPVVRIKNEGSIVGAAVAMGVAPSIFRTIFGS
ncbi:hypothetical protein B0H11DRAFT_318256 [Mycena galericulata]|nr:hypothetical protein B0H11DRAFT_318256 [Mycena galericulata]